MLRRGGKWPGIHEISPVRVKGLWWEAFVEKVDCELGMKERGSDG